MPMNGSHYCPTIHSFSTTHVSDSVDENNDPIYSPFTHQTTHPYDTSAVPGRARNTHARPPSMSRQALADLLDHYHQLLYLYDVDMINNRTSYADLRTMIRHQHTEVEAFRRAIQHSIEHIEFQILGQLQILGDQVTLLVNHIVGNQNGMHIASLPSWTTE